MPHPLTLRRMTINVLGKHKNLSSSANAGNGAVYDWHFDGQGHSNRCPEALSVCPRLLPNAAVKHHAVINHKVSVEIGPEQKGRDQKRKG